MGVSCQWVKPRFAGVVVIGFSGRGFGLWLWVDHDRFVGHGESMARCRGSCSVHSTICGYVVVALWVEHGGGMREERVEGGGDHENQVESGVRGVWREGKGQKGIAGGSAQSPRLRSRNTTGINEGEGTVLSEGDVVALRQTSSEDGRALVEEKVGNEDEAGIEIWR